jgi:hypothetical protein
LGSGRGKGTGRKRFTVSWSKGVTGIMLAGGADLIKRETQNNNKKTVAFLYINNEQAEKEIRKTIPFKIASKK